MSDHPNVTVIKQATQAIVDDDREAISRCLSDDLVFRVRGHLPGEGDYRGIDAFLEVVGGWFEMTGGTIELEDLFLGADADRAVQWERAVLGAGDDAVQTENAWTFRLSGGKVVEMAVLSGITSAEAASLRTPVG
jgi:uncharacterized protein